MGKWRVENNRLDAKGGGAFEDAAKSPNTVKFE